MRSRRAAFATAVALAVVIVTPAVAGRPAPPPPDLAFAGYQWAVKMSSGKVGPGPNAFSASNAWVDPAGDLHLAITRTRTKWYPAEVINRASLGYGTYRWTIASPLDDLDPNVVLGLFTWSDDPAYAHREIDLEWARWGNATDPTNVQAVVQPYDAPGHLHRFAQPPGATSTSHAFTWAPGRVEFRSEHTDHRVIDAWAYMGSDVPIPGGENARMNLWLFRGAAPTDGQPVEIVIADFTFTPSS